MLVVFGPFRLVVGRGANVAPGLLPQRRDLLVDLAAAADDAMGGADRRQPLRSRGPFAVEAECVSRDLVGRERAIGIRGEQLADAGLDLPGAAAHGVSVIILARLL